MVQDLYVLMITAGVVSLIFKIFKQPVVLGYIVAGVLVGPYVCGDRWVNPENVETWGEVGVLFLLFSMGLEFSVKKLIQMGSTAIIGAGVIVAGMMALGFGLAMASGMNMINALFLGGMCCMSSTAIVFKTIDEKGLGAQKFAKLCLGILVVEDIFAVILMVVLSSIAIKNQFEGRELLFQVARLFAYLTAWFVGGIFLLPTFLSKFKKYLNDETLTIISIGICLGMVLLAEEARFSSALGAFVVGSILAETVEAERIEHLTLPIKNVFGAIFFISVGMMINPAMLVEYWCPILLLVLLVTFGQIFFGTFGPLLAGQPLKVSMQAGFSLVQVGEFAFIIAKLGEDLKVTDSSLYPIIVAVSVVTTFLTPYIMPLSGPAYNWLWAHIHPETKHFLEEYAQARNTKKDSKVHAGLGKMWKFIEIKILMLPGINNIFQLFSKNLYARERLAESQRSLMKEVESMLLTLDIHISEFIIPENSNLVGMKLRETQIRNASGINIVRIVRGGININIPGGNNILFPGDKIVVAGTDEQMKLFQDFLNNSLVNEDEFGGRNTEIVLDNIMVEENSPIIGKSIIDTEIRDKAQCIVMCLTRPDEGLLLLNPDPHTTFKEGDIVVVAGEKTKIQDYKTSISYNR